MWSVGVGTSNAVVMQSPVWAAGSGWRALASQTSGFNVTELKIWELEKLLIGTMQSSTVLCRSPEPALVSRSQTFFLLLKTEL